MKVFAEERSVEERLSKAHKKILPLLADGFCAREIGEKLGISKRTVEAHISQMMFLCRAKNSVHLVVILMREGIIK